MSMRMSTLPLVVSIGPPPPLDPALASVRWNGASDCASPAPAPSAPPSGAKAVPTPSGPPESLVPPNSGAWPLHAEPMAARAESPTASHPQARPFPVIVALLRGSRARRSPAFDESRAIPMQQGQSQDARALEYAS